LRATTSRTMSYLAGKPKEDNRMTLKRLNPKVGMVKCRESCVPGEAEFAEPKFDLVYCPPVAATLSRRRWNTLWFVSAVESFLQRRARMTGERTNGLPKHTERLMSVKAGWPNPRERYGHGVAIVAAMPRVMPGTGRRAAESTRGT
jgi:hypothetical protein